jgi:hypothetical protein
VMHKSTVSSVFKKTVCNDRDIALQVTGRTSNYFDSASIHAYMGI